MKWLRLSIIRETIILLLLMLFLCLADAYCYSITLPVEVDVQHGSGTLHVGNTTLILGQIGMPAELQLAPHDAVIHEYQIDGTDSTNNLTLDPTYLHQIESSPYYRFQAWMRDLDGTSRWRHLEIRTSTTSQVQRDNVSNGDRIALPSSPLLQIRVQLQRPETPMTLNLFMANGTVLHITLDRNDRQINVTRDIPQLGKNLPVADTFFPTDSAPFAAMVIDTLLRTTLWAILLLLIVLIGEAMISLVLERWPVRQPGKIALPVSLMRSSTTAWSTLKLRGRLFPLRAGWQRLTKALHPGALAALVASLLFVSWISTVQYHAEPHIFDANAYLFAAKMYALGHLSVPLPPAIDRFPGPFMIQFHGRWFAQYPPGTALTLVPGIWLGIPWLVEPLLGTFALLGIGLLAARLYDRRVATLAVLLGTLSPFYSYLAASYLSHTIALFYLVWGLWALLRFTQGEALWNLPLSAALFGMAGLTRDLVAVLFVAIVVPGVMLLSWQRGRHSWRPRWIVGGALFLVVALLFIGINLAFNALLTGSPWITPRSLFFEGDHWGFGPGIGFYGQHTLAAGFVNLDELLTIMAIDLFGWPFYLTFAFLLMPFLTRRAVSADWFLLLAAIIITSAYIGYFYHGIYLGPRYLFETLPFLLILTARGILTLSAAGASQVKNKLFSMHPGIETSTSRIPISIVTLALVVLLIACNLLYFLPRQIELHRDYTGLPAGYRLDLATVYHPPLHTAIVVTSDAFLYQFVLFPLNDPLLHDDVIYAQASNISDYTELHQAYPGRTLYRLDVSADGSVKYSLLVRATASTPSRDHFFFIQPFIALQNTKACDTR